MSYRGSDNCFKSGHEIVYSLYVRSPWLLYLCIFYTVQTKMHLCSYKYHAQVIYFYLHDNVLFAIETETKIITYTVYIYNIKRSFNTFSKTCYCFLKETWFPIKIHVIQYSYLLENNTKALDQHNVLWCPVADKPRLMSYQTRLRRPIIGFVGVCPSDFVC